MKVVSCSKEGIESAFEIIKDGGTVVYPTDTVYGIGCDPFNSDAVAMVYKTKSREFSKPLPVLGKSKHALEEIGVFNEISEKLASFFWPGGLTIIVWLKDKRLQSSMRLPENKIAVRMPANECCLDLLEKCDFLIGTSANMSGSPSHTDPNKLRKEFSECNVFIDGGTIKSTGESTIIDVTAEKPTVLRKGIISYEKINSVL